MISRTRSAGLPPVRRSSESSGTEAAVKKGRSMFTVLLVNQSSRPDVTSAWLQKVCDACNDQLKNDFCPAYGLVTWTVTLDPAQVTATDPRLYVRDLSDVQGAAGYHDNPNNRPEGKAFDEGATLDDLSVTISHELLEMIGDLTAQRFQLAADGVDRAEEACDAVEDRTYRHPNGILLSDFVTPAWYVSGSKGPWDHLRALAAPLTRTAGGYVILERGGQVDTDPPEAKARPKKAHPESRTSMKIALKVQVVEIRERSRAAIAALPSAPAIDVVTNPAVIESTAGDARMAPDKTFDPEATITPDGTQDMCESDKAETEPAAADADPESAPEPVATSEGESPEKPAGGDDA